MKIVHFSDTHLGFQAYDAVNDAGINAREQDVYDAFERVVDRILEIKPDLVIHSGDFFHRPSPSNRALTFGLEQLQRLSKENIPAYIIAGNHETPKNIITSPILRAFQTLDNVKPMFSEQWEYFETGDVVVHGVPHINDQRLLLEALEQLKPISGKFNILMLHSSFGKKYLMEEYGEQIFPVEFESKLAEFQYIALGHWHNFQQTSGHQNAWYAGSTERLSDTEAGAEKGFVLLDVQSPEQFDLQFQPITSRPWHKLTIEKCQDKSVGVIRAELEQFRDEHQIAGSIISLFFLDITPEQSLELSNLKLREIFSDAFQILPNRKTWSDRSFVEGIEAHQFESLDSIFNDYIAIKYPDDAVLAQKMAAKARQYFDLNQ